jgi:hypothetical protein
MQRPGQSVVYEISSPGGDRRKISQLVRDALKISEKR